MGIGGYLAIGIAVIGWAFAVRLRFLRGRAEKRAARLQSAALEGPGPAALFGRDLVILRHNPAFARIFQPDAVPERLDADALERMEIPQATVDLAVEKLRGCEIWEGQLAVRRPLGDVVNLAGRAIPVGGGRALWLGEDRTLLEQLNRRNKNLVADVGLAMSTRTAELMERHAQLQKAKEAYQDLYDNAPHMYFTLDGGGRVVDCNLAAARALGVERRGAIGRPLVDFAHVDARPALEEALETLARGRPVTALETALLTAKGETLEAILDAVPSDPVAGRAGSAAMYRVQLVDITALKSQQELLRQAFHALAEKNALLEVRNEQALRAHRLKSDFIATVSHELKTPLHAVIGYAELLENGVYGEMTETQNYAIDSIVSRGADLLRLINDLLDLSRIEAGRLTLEDERFSPAEVVEECLATGGMLLQDKLAQVKMLGASDKAPPMVRGDRGRYKQVVLNLVSNAIKHTESGKIDLVCRAEEDGTYTTAVIDSGPGIPAHEIPFIFDAFYQIDGTTTRKVGGAGLGLAIARHLAERMGGHLHVTSRRPGGSCFYLRLPVETPHEVGRVAEEVPTALAKTQGRAPATVLLVVDERDLRVRTYLEGDGFLVDSAATSREGLERARTRLPTVVVIGAWLSDPPLRDLLAALRSDPLTAHIPVVALTRGEPIPKEGPGSPDGVLRMPVDPRELSQLIWSRIGRGAVRILFAGDPDGPIGEQVPRLRAAGLAVAVAENTDRTLERLGEERIPVLLLEFDHADVDGFAILDAIETMAPNDRPRLLAVTDGRGLNLLQRRSLERRAVAVLRRTGTEPDLLLNAVRALTVPLQVEGDTPRATA